MSRGSMKSDEFLAFLNYDVFWENNKARVKTIEEKRGQLVLPLTSIKRLVFKEEFDLVIIGPCGDLVDILNSERGRLELFPMGECVVMENEPKKSWLHSIVEDYNLRKVLIIPECCGGYGEWYKKMLKSLFPSVTFIFCDADCLDYYANQKKILGLVNQLIEQNIIGIE